MEEANKEKAIKFVYDPDMTLAERLQAQREQMQNLREQEELKRMLANQDKVMYKISRHFQEDQKVKEKIKSPEEQIEDLRYKESELLEKEYQIDGDLKKVTEYYESVESDAHKMHALLDELAYRYSPQNGFEHMRDEFLQNWQSFRANFEEDSEVLKKQKRKVSEEYDKAYHERIRIVNSLEDKRNYQ